MRQPLQMRFSIRFTYAFMTSYQRGRESSNRGLGTHAQDGANPEAIIRLERSLIITAFYFLSIMILYLSFAIMI